MSSTAALLVVAAALHNTPTAAAAAAAPIIGAIRWDAYFSQPGEKAFEGQPRAADVCEFIL